MEKCRGPTDFGQEEDDNLSDDQKTVEDGPEDAGGLVGNGRVSIKKSRQRRRAQSAEGNVRDVIVIGVHGAVRRGRV